MAKSQSVRSAHALSSSSDRKVLVEHGVYLTFKLALSPALIYCLQLIVFSFFRIRNGYKQFILRPVQLRTQCIRIRISPVKLTVQFQLSHSESTAIQRLYFFRQITDDVLAVVRAFLALLLFFRDALADSSVPLNPAEVDASHSF